MHLLNNKSFKFLLVIIYLYITNLHADPDIDNNSFYFDPLSSFGVTAGTETFTSVFGVERFFNKKTFTLSIPIITGYHYLGKRERLILGSGFGYKKMFKNHYNGWFIGSNWQFIYIDFDWITPPEANEEVKSEPDNMLFGRIDFGKIWHNKITIFTMSISGVYFHQFEGTFKSKDWFFPMISFTFGFPFSIKPIFKFNEPE